MTTLLVLVLAWAVLAAATAGGFAVLATGARILEQRSTAAAASLGLAPGDDVPEADPPAPSDHLPAPRTSSDDQVTAPV